MDSLLTRYVMVGVGILIVVMIATVLIMALNGLADSYGQVSNTNISIKDRMDNFVHKYHGAEFNGVEVINILKTYEDVSNVEINFFPNQVIVHYQVGHTEPFAEYVKESMEKGYHGMSYNEIYNCSVEQVGNKYKLTFSYID